MGSRLTNSGIAERTARRNFQLHSPQGCKTAVNRLTQILRLRIGLPDRFIDHGRREILLDEVGLTPPKVAARAVRALAPAARAPHHLTPSPRWNLRRRIRLTAHVTASHATDLPRVGELHASLGT